MELNSAKLLYDIVNSVSKTFPEQNLSIFQIRLGENFDRLIRLYDHIYGTHPDAEQNIVELVITMAESYLNRSPGMRDLDIQRTLEKDWYMSSNWVSTMLYVDRYCENLNGLHEKIAYLEELGINYVHLMPLLKMPEILNDGGYAVSDYRTIDKRFGTMEDIRKIAKTFRSKGMLLEMDLVLNHTSNQHEWVQKAIAGDKEYQDMYYIYNDRHIPELFEQTLLEVFPESSPGNFTFVESIGKWVHTTFNSYQWDLNYTNPKVFTEMTKIMLNLCNHGVDVLRLDAVAFMWKKLGTQSQNLDETHLLLQLFKVCTKITAPGVLFKAEAIVQPKEIVKYLGGGIADECEIAYNASLMVCLWDAIATQNKTILEQCLTNTPRLPKGTTWINYIRCHDDIGLGYADEDIINAGFIPHSHRKFIVSYYVGEYSGSHAKGQYFMYNPKTDDARITGSTSSLLGLERAIEEDDSMLIDTAIQKILLLHSIILTIGGIPLIYYGDEIASLNDYSYLDDPNKKDDSRWLNRPVINWVNAEKRTEIGTIEQRVFDGLKRMINLRKLMPEFYNENDYKLIEHKNNHVFTFLRENGEHKTLVVANCSPRIQYLSQSVTSQAGITHKVKDIFEDKFLEPVGNHVELKPYQFLWLKEVDPESI